MDQRLTKALAKAGLVYVPEDITNIMDLWLLGYNDAKERKQMLKEVKPWFQSVYKGGDITNLYRGLTIKGTPTELLEMLLTGKSIPLRKNDTESYSYDPAMALKFAEFWKKSNTKTHMIMEQPKIKASKVIVDFPYVFDRLKTGEFLLPDDWDPKYFMKEYAEEREVVTESICTSCTVKEIYGMGYTTKKMFINDMAQVQDFGWEMKELTKAQATKVNLKYLYDMGKKVVLMYLWKGNLDLYVWFSN